MTPSASCSWRCSRRRWTSTATGSRKRPPRLASRSGACTRCRSCPSGGRTSAGASSRTRSTTSKPRRAVPIKLYVIPASHPCLAAELMLKHKGLAFKRRDLVMAAHKPILRSLGFSGTTVPALKADGRKVQGSVAIANYLDEIKAEPPLYPADPERRRAVEEAEAWGDSELQSVARRVAVTAVAGDRSHLKEFLADYKLGVPTGIAAATAGPVIWIERKIHKASPDAVRADLPRVPGLIDHVDRLIADGVIGGDQPNAADFQIAPSVRLLMALDQLRPMIDGRPAAAFATRVVPDFKGRVPAGLPAEWIVPPQLSPAPAAPSSAAPS